MRIVDLMNRTTALINYAKCCICSYRPENNIFSAYINNIYTFIDL